MYNDGAYLFNQFKFLLGLCALGVNASTVETVLCGGSISVELLKAPKRELWACRVNLEPTTNQQKYSFVA
jgi:hypothetical protein